jgi:hypothetical protein
MKLAAQHKAETAGIGDGLGDIANEIDLAGLAVLGLANELDDVHGHGQRIEGRLLDTADKVRAWPAVFHPSTLPPPRSQGHGQGVVTGE